MASSNGHASLHLFTVICNGSVSRDVQVLDRRLRLTVQLDRQENDKLTEFQYCIDPS